MMIPGMNVPNAKRNEYGLWMTPKENWKSFHVCTECGYDTYNRPSTFCGGCGALMLNAEAAVVEFLEYLDAVAKKADETTSEQADEQKEGASNV